jgi:hypothetical protein
MLETVPHDCFQWIRKSFHPADCKGVLRLSTPDTSLEWRDKGTIPLTKRALKCLTHYFPIDGATYLAQFRFELENASSPASARISGHCQRRGTDNHTKVTAVAWSRPNLYYLTYGFSFYRALGYLLYEWGP